MLFLFDLLFPSIWSHCSMGAGGFLYPIEMYGAILHPKGAGSSPEDPAITLLGPPVCQKTISS